MLVCEQRQLHNVVCLSVTGELDVTSVRALFGHLKDAAAISPNVVMDLEGLRYIDPIGINALLDSQRWMKQRGRHLMLAAVSSRMKRLKEIVAIGRVLPVFPTVEMAVETFNKPADAAGG